MAYCKDGFLKNLMMLLVLRSYERKAACEIFLIPNPSFPYPMMLYLEPP
jgi:hypothetical protein